MVELKIQSPEITWQMEGRSPLATYHLGTGEQQFPDSDTIWYQAFCSERNIKESSMIAFTPEIERQMKWLFNSLGERDRRRYAVIEATKLGHGGIEYIAGEKKCDPKLLGKGLVSHINDLCCD